MRRLYVLLLISLSLACGNSISPVEQAVVASEENTLPVGASRSHPFTIDLDTMIAPALLATVGPLNGASVVVLVLSEAEFALWDAGETYAPRFETVSTGNDMNIGIDTSGNYRLVISNRDGTIPVTYGIQADVFWQNL